MTSFYALIPAAGIGARMGAFQPKQYLQLAGKPVLRHVLDVFSASALVVDNDQGKAAALLPAEPLIG